MLKMRNLLNKKLNKKGFTLAELLVVVAIIAILVAISIPVFTGKMDQAKEQTDAANMRAAKAAAVTEFLSSSTSFSDMYYDAENGVLTTGAITKKYGQSETNKNKVIKISVSSAGAVAAEWE